MKKLIVALLVLSGCQKLKPESVSIPEYPDFKVLMKEQVALQGKTKIKKTVWLEGQSEARVLEMDSTKWAEELTFLKEINPNQPEYVGAFAKSKEGESQILTLGSEESGPLKEVKYLTDGDNYERILASFHEDKDVYVHHRDIELSFEEGKLSSLNIDGYQKMMFKDTVRFRIALKVN